MVRCKVGHNTGGIVDRCNTIQSESMARCLKHRGTISRCGDLAQLRLQCWRLWSGLMRHHWLILPANALQRGRDETS